MKKPRARPVVCTWDGDTFVPLHRFRKLCDHQFVVGEEYPLEVVENRSLASHGGYFAALHQGFENLTEENARQFPSEEHLRKWCLVQCGYCTQADYGFDSKKDAMMFAAMVRQYDQYAVIRVSETVVRIFTARSQAMYGPDRMKKEEFEASKREVLDLVASMSRTTRSQLNKEGRRYGR